MAADIPSGLSAVDGRVQGVAVVAQLCVTMAVAKPGLFLGDGPKFWQDLEIADIGVLITCLNLVCAKPSSGAQITGLTGQAWPNTLTTPAVL